MVSSDEFEKTIQLGLETAFKAKAVMKKKGLRRARLECPKCGGWIHCQLAGRKDHLHMACETPGCLQVME